MKKIIFICLTTFAFNVHADCKLAVYHNEKLIESTPLVPIDRSPDVSILTANTASGIKVFAVYSGRKDGLSGFSSFHIVTPEGAEASSCGYGTFDSMERTFNGAGASQTRSNGKWVETLECQ